MKKVKLTKYDYRMIGESAHRMYIEKNPIPYGEDGFVCACFIESFVRYAAGKKWVIKDGKILEAENED